MSDVDHAVAQIASIRSQLASSSRFSGIAPSANVIAGFFAFCLTVWLSGRSSVVAPTEFINIWGTYVLFITVFGATSTAARAKKKHGQRAFYMFTAAYQRLVPFMAAGLVISLIVTKFAVDSIWILPGLWLMFIGLAGFSMMGLLPQSIAIASAWYFLFGAIVMAYSLHTQSFTPWMLGLPLAGGQLLVAIVLSFSEGVLSGK